MACRALETLPVAPVAHTLRHASMWLEVHPPGRGAGAGFGSEVWGNGERSDSQKTLCVLAEGLIAGQERMNHDHESRRDGCGARRGR